MKIGFIGCGNMATAIIDGVINSKFEKAENVCVYDVSQVALDSAKEKYGVTSCQTEKDLVYSSDVIILAVKPNVISSVLNKIDNVIAEKKPLIVSIAAGKTISFIESNLTTSQRIIRVMPNINAKVAEAICAYCANSNCNECDKSFISSLLSKIGKSLELDESYFPLFGVLGGCAPAFAYMFIDSLARAGVKNGMKKDDALKIAAQTVYGSAKMILESDEHPWKLIDNVCSPGGTTIEGVTSLQADGFETAVCNAVDKSLEKDKKL